MKHYLKYIFIISIIFLLINLLFKFIVRTFNLLGPQDFESFKNSIWILFISCFWPLALFFALKYMIRKTNEIVFWKILISAFLIEFLIYSFNYVYDYAYFEFFISPTLSKNINARENLMNILSGSSKPQFNFFYNPFKTMFYELKNGRYFRVIQSILDPLFYMNNSILRSFFIGSFVYGMYRINFQNSKN